MDINAIIDSSPSRQATARLIRNIQHFLWHHQQYLKDHPEEAGDWEFLINPEAPCPGNIESDPEP